MVEQQRNQVSEMHFDKFPDLLRFSVGKRVSRQRYVPVLAASNQWTIFRRRSQFQI